jgi:transposase
LLALKGTVVKTLKEEIVTMDILRRQGETNQAIAVRLGITEGAVRYHLKRLAQEAKDGRAKLSLIEQLQLVEVVEHWWKDQIEELAKDRAPNIKELWTFLSDNYRYTGAYKSVQKYVQKRFPKPPQRPFRRVETPAAAQTQSDWMDVPIRLSTDQGIELVTLYGFVMTLSHSRKSAVIWSSRMDQLAWHRVHNEAFKRLHGIAAVNRIDNLKTGVAHGSGIWGEVNTAYAAYARTMGFHVDPHQVRKPNQKGKVERRVGVVKSLDFKRVFASIEELQRYTDETMQREAVVRKCPVTGESVHATWLKERELLRPLPATMPEPFDLIKQAPVYKDCTIRFEGKTLSVPFRYAHKTVEVRGCAHVIQIVDPKTGEIVQEFPRNSRGLVQIDQACYEPTEAERLDDSIPKPLPLGAMAKRIEELATAGAPCRSIDFYESLVALKATSRK